MQLKVKKNPTIHHKLKHVLRKTHISNMNALELEATSVLHINALIAAGPVTDAFIYHF
jgi:hypothetical protein